MLDLSLRERVGIVKRQAENGSITSETVLELLLALCEHVLESGDHQDEDGWQ